MQGFNMGRYVPPEHEGTLSGNQLAGKHALGARASKLKQGILTVRFELPFAIWCTTCPPETIIGQGVRFNAEKKKIGNYYSTPVFSFRMKHAACGGWIEIHTDPKNTAYVVVEGAKKRDYGEEREDVDGGMRILTDEERERRRQDAFAQVEGKMVDKRQAKSDTDRIQQLMQRQERDWDDPYTQNQKLRKTFRAERKVRQKKEAATEELRESMAFAPELQDATKEDVQIAKFVQEFGPLTEPERLQTPDKAALSAPLFQQRALGPSRESHHAKKTRPSASAVLGATLQGNTRAVVDPFSVANGNPASKTATGHLIPGLKRKRPPDS
jgi:coiled-coil domain-containing protein 130